MNVEHAVRFAEERLRHARAGKAAVRAVVGAAGVVGVALVAAALLGRLGAVGRGGALALALVLPMVVGVAVHLVVLLRGRSKGAARQRAAVELDVRLGLSERVSTARYLEERPDDAAGVASIVSGQAERALDDVGPDRLREAFPLPSGRPALVATAVLAAVALVAPALPVLGGFGGASDGTEVDPAVALKEKQEVREAARRLEKAAAEIERAAERAALEKARRAARKVREEAERLERDAPTKRDSMVRLANVGDALEKAKKDLLEASRDDPGEVLGAASPTGALEELARELSILDPEGLSTDLDALRDDLEQLGEPGAAPGERTLGLEERRRVRDLMDRTEEMRDAFERLRDELARRDAERYRSLAQEASERLGELLEELRRLDRLPGEGGEASEGRLLTSEELAALEEMLERLAAMSDEEFAELMEMLREMEGLEALACRLGECRGGLGGLGSSPGASRAASLLRRMAASGRQGGRGEMGPNDGLGQGGAARKGPDDGRGEESTPVRGRLDPTGDLGPKIPFRGIPNPNEAKLSFDAALRRAAADAEESLGKDLLPPSSRPYVRRYFESLRATSESDGK